MNSSLTKGEVLVVGGSGSIGWPICRALMAEGYPVISMTRGLHPRPEEYALHLNGTAAPVRLQEINCNVIGVNCDPALDRIRRQHSQYCTRLSAIIYAVGDCPPGSFDNEVAVPLCDLEDGILCHALTLHVSGLLNVMRNLHTCLRPSGHVVVISSAITRLTDATCPAWLHAGHYAAAKAAQDELVRWLRRDPRIKDRHIMVHRLAPAAVDTPFHRGCQHQPPVALSVDDVASRVIDCLEGTKIIDEMMMAPPPTIIAGQTNL